MPTPVIDLKIESGFSILAVFWQGGVMNSGKTVFAHIVDHFPAYTFIRCIERYQSHYKVKHFSCLDQREALGALLHS